MHLIIDCMIIGGSIISLERFKGNEGNGQSIKLSDNFIKMKRNENLILSHIVRTQVLAFIAT